MSMTMDVLSRYATRAGGSRALAACGRAPGPRPRADSYTAASPATRVAGATGIGVPLGGSDVELSARPRLPRVAATLAENFQALPTFVPRADPAFAVL